MQKRLNLEAFNGLTTAPEFIERAGGDVRVAETAAWELWERTGKQVGHPYVEIAIAINATRFAPAVR